MSSMRPEIGKQPIDMKSGSNPFRPDLENTGIDPLGPQSPQVNFLFYTEENRILPVARITKVGRPQDQVLTEITEYTKKGYELHSEDAVTVMLMPRERRPRAFVSRFDGPYKDFYEFMFGDKRGRNKHIRTWRIPDTIADEKKAVEYVKQLRNPITDEISFSEVLPVKWEDLRKQ